ncbi:beta-galactosidase [Pseudooctadecabacter sp.]|uniref:beta-galactosidase n=1 Tax=Pseudooctadecabacter sp. TaxID=1966338 RepID=UPI0025E25FC1|nr:beta-galactosidase [Pseudooctadecabacter sp.]
MKRTLGVCYYPEHWPEDIWADDAARMVAAGISWVRIGEFAWSRIEPKPDQFDFDWLDRAIDTLGAAGLKVILGTPTATPPRWMLDKHPDMLAVDAEGRPRGFGSRRHYCFSHQGYRAESKRITAILADRYGKDPHIAAWQTDNEYACHDTTRSYSFAATQGFQQWLAQKYQSPDALNRAWGNVFWSMEYDDFADIDLPNLTVTEPNHPHVLDFYRYSSDMVADFNREQVAEIRERSTAPIIHNYMGRETSFDHFKVGADLDIASWDSYPIGFLSDRLEGDPDFKARFMRQGHPDNQAFHHDLYRAVGRAGGNPSPAGGRWWIMEQQPGPVNWAPYNPAPLPGMARLWAWEAFAHGAETVCYFRWRQAPFAQEQMHAGLLRPDSADAPALAECLQVAREIEDMPDVGTAKADVALVFDYESAWAWEAQPQGADFDQFRLAFAAYRACRRLGLNVDIVPPNATDLSDYKFALAPGIMALSAPLKKALGTTLSLIGPRTDTKTEHISIPTPMGPNVDGLDVTVTLTESIPPQASIPLENGGQFVHWREVLEGGATVRLRTADGIPAIAGDTVRYLAGWPDDSTWETILRDLCDEIGLTHHTLPDGLRLRDTDTHRFVFNYAPEPLTWNSTEIPAAGVHWEAL